MFRKRAKKRRRMKFPMYVTWESLIKKATTEKNFNAVWTFVLFYST